MARMACALGALLLIAQPAAAYKILVYNLKHGHSHVNFLANIADVLADAGHNVTTLMPIVNGALSDVTEKSRVIHVQAHPDVTEFYAKPMPISFFEMNVMNPLLLLVLGPMLSDVYGKTCQRVLDEPGLIERLRDEHYDVYITENFELCGIGLAEALQPKSIISSSSTALCLYHFGDFGVEPSASYRPSLYSSSSDLSLGTRLLSWYGDLLTRVMFGFIRRASDLPLKKRFGDDYPTAEEQSANVAYVFTNSEPLIESAAATSARIINIPGIGARAPRPLDAYWDSIMALRSRVVLISFGSIAHSCTLPMSSKLAILKAISAFPDVTFIWKYEQLSDAFSTQHAAHTAHLVLTQWMPQADLLNHTNMAAFITHGGMGSTQETAIRGVPGIFVPLFGDQFRNAGLMQLNGFGFVYDKYDLSDGDKLAAAIREVLDNPKYAANARRVSAMLARKPYSSVDLLVKHVEFAAEFGPSSALRPRSVDMGWIAYHNADVYAILIGSALFCAIATLKLLTLICSRVARKVKRD